MKAFMLLHANEDGASLWALSTCEQRFVTAFYDPRLVFTALSVEAIRHFAGTYDLLTQSCCYHLLVRCNCVYSQNIAIKGVLSVNLLSSFYVLVVRRVSHCLTSSVSLRFGFVFRLLRPATIIPALHGSAGMLPNISARSYCK
jgi:hypothetical protein